MDTKIEILGGANTIGGNIVLIEGESSRLILDLGIPLTDSSGESQNLKPFQQETHQYLPEIKDLYTDNQEKKTLIFCSHAHPDHYGLMRYINKSVPIYTTRITRELILKSSLILYKNKFDNLNLRDIDTVVETDDFMVEPIVVNHSVGGACAFLIVDKKTGKRIVYSGDFRLHGREKSDNLIEKMKNCDYMITEGTSLCRESYETLSEQEVEDRMTAVFNQKKMSIVACSALNTDRILSVYNACKRTGKTFVIDPYTAFLLETFNSRGLPDYRSDNIKVYCVWNNPTKKVFTDNRYMKFKYNKIEFKEILNRPEKYVIKDNYEMTGYLEKYLKFEEVNLVYSYWAGYLSNPDYRWSRYINNLIKIHTSGHISTDDLKSIINKINPKKILPVHTLARRKFKDLFGEKICDSLVEVLV